MGNVGVVRAMGWFPLVGGCHPVGCTDGSTDESIDGNTALVDALVESLGILQETVA